MTLNGQFCLISNFCDQSMSFLEKYKKFSFLGGGGHSSNFLIFSNFLSHFTPKRLKMAHDGKFCLKSCLLRWENIGKLRIRWNWPFRFILSHFGGKRMEKLEIRQNWPFQVILRHFGGKRSEKLQIGQNWPFQVILSHFGGKRLEKLWIGRNWPFRVILSHFSGKSCESGRIGHSRSFWDTSVGRDWKSCKLGEIGHSESFWATPVGKDGKSCELGRIWTFWVILSHFGTKQIGKVANRAKLAIPGHSKPLW